MKRRERAAGAAEWSDDRRRNRLRVNAGEAE